MKLAVPDESASRLIAAATATAILLLMGKLLLRGPTMPAGVEGEQMRVVYLQRERWQPPLAPPPPDASGAPAAGDEPEPLAPARATATTTAPPRAVRAPATLANRLYTGTGQVRVPAGARIDALQEPEIAANPPGQRNERELRDAERLLYRRNPIVVEENRFSKDWVTDGTLGDVAAESMGRGMKKIAKAIFGEDIQSPVARPPPEVRYNPALYEQRADLGSERTGDAYKAAPITYQKVPGLEGEGSRRIRAAMEALQARVAACDRARAQGLFAPVRAHLAELESAEYALAHGADPVMARQMLPRRADSAYDLARRALWHAEHQLASCLR